MKREVTPASQSDQGRFIWEEEKSVEFQNIILQNVDPIMEVLKELDNDNNKNLDSIVENINYIFKDAALKLFSFKKKKLSS